MAVAKKKAARAKAPAKASLKAGKSAVSAPASKASRKNSAGKGLLIAAVMIAAVSAIGVQIYFKARREAALKFDVLRLGKGIATGLADGQGMSPLALQGDMEDNLFFLDGQGTDPARLQKFSPASDFLAKYTPKKAEQMITAPADLDVDKEGNPWVLLKNGDIKILDKNLAWKRSISTHVSGPSGLGILPDGRFVVASQNDNKIVVFSAEGLKVGEFGGPGTKSGDISSPVRMRTTQSGLVAVLELVSGGMHMKVFGPDFKLISQFNLDKVPWCEPVKLSVTNDDKMYLNDHMGGTGLVIWSLKTGNLVGVSKGTTDNQFFISPGSSGANKYSRSVYVHSVGGLTKCRLPEGK